MTSESKTNEPQGLAAALAAFQAEDGLTFAKTKTAKVQTRTGGTYTYAYADLGTILPVVRPLLAKHGLSWSAKPGMSDSGEMVLDYRLLHVSGESDEGRMPLGVQKGVKPQELGSAITYARRYALTAQLNLATDEDDDAQAAQSTQRQPPAMVPSVADEGQRSRILAAAAEMKMPSTLLAKTLLMATGNEERLAELSAGWKSEQDARQWLVRALERLPADDVEKVLKAIEAPE